jgi:hypothetical protein
MLLRDAEMARFDASAVVAAHAFLSVIPAGICCFVSR